MQRQEATGAWLFPGGQQQDPSEVPDKWKGWIKSRVHLCCPGRSKRRQHWRHGYNRGVESIEKTSMETNTTYIQGIKLRNKLSTEQSSEDKARDNYTCNIAHTRTRGQQLSFNRAPQSTRLRVWVEAPGEAGESH